MKLLEMISFIADPRQSYKVKYPLTALLFTTLCAVLCGCQSWLDVSDFCEARKLWLNKYVDLGQRTPSCWTFRRLFILLEANLIEKLLLDGGHLTKGNIKPVKGFKVEKGRLSYQIYDLAAKDSPQLN